MQRKSGLRNYNNQEYQRHQKQTNQRVLDIQDIMTLKKQ